MTIQDSKDSVQKPVAEEQSNHDDENIDPVLQAWPPRSIRRRVPQL
jgi:hypothetical protein